MDNRYIRVPKELLQNKSVSLKAKGMYALILSLPVNWDCSIQELVEVSGTGKAAVRSAVQELEQSGYLERHQMMDDNGQFCGMEYELKER